MHSDLQSGEQSADVRVKVILIRPEDDPKSEAYRRIQVSHQGIPMDKWIQLLPESRLLALV